MQRAMILSIVPIIQGRIPFSDRVVRGKIISADGQVLAQTNVYEDGTEERTYPYANMFAHVVGYDTNGKKRTGIRGELPASDFS